MKTSAKGRAFIEAFEGRYLNAYDDGTGTLTIGFGHTSAAGPPAVSHGMCISDEECDEILGDDLGKTEQQVDSLISVFLTQAQYDALVSFQFNTGALGISIAANINAGKIAAAMNTLLQYDHAGGRVMAGLIRRRQAERLMFIGQVDDALKLAKGHDAMRAGVPMPQKIDHLPHESALDRAFDAAAKDRS